MVAASPVLYEVTAGQLVLVGSLRPTAWKKRQETTACHWPQGVARGLPSTRSVPRQSPSLVQETVAEILGEIE